MSNKRRQIKHTFCNSRIRRYNTYASVRKQVQRGSDNVTYGTSEHCPLQFYNRQQHAAPAARWKPEESELTLTDENILSNKWLTAAGYLHEHGTNACARDTNAYGGTSVLRSFRFKSGGSFTFLSDLEVCYAALINQLLMCLESKFCWCFFFLACFWQQITLQSMISPWLIIHVSWLLSE